MVDVRDDAPFPVFEFLDGLMFPLDLKRLSTLGKDAAYMPVRATFQNTTGPSGVAAAMGTFCPLSTPIQRPVFAASGTSIDTESKAYQMPRRDCESLMLPDLA